MLEFSVSLKDRHQAEEQCRAGSLTSPDRVCLRRRIAILELSGNEFASARREHNTIPFIRRAILRNAIAAALMSYDTQILGVSTSFRRIGQFGISQQRSHGRRVQGRFLDRSSIVILRLAVILSATVLGVIKGCGNRQLK